MPYAFDRGATWELFETLPFRIRLPDGTTRTALQELSGQALTNLGFKTVTRPDYDPEAESCTFNPTTGEFDVADLSMEELNRRLAEKLAKPLTRYQFRQLFTSAEKLAIDGWAEDSNLTGNLRAAVRTAMKEFDAVTEVVVTLPETSTLLGVLVAAGYLTENRVNQILNKETPS